MASAGNLLGREKSPYLRQHADNPVEWRPWGEDAFEEARRRDCPVLLSIGYAACHWCHVMAHESFENLETAALMNRLFVNIKVDREERPDVDHVFMSALHALGEQGGWPLTMFLLPDGAPFWGGTYFPPEARWGRPSFRQVLTAISAAFEARDASLRANADGIGQALGQIFSPTPGTLESAAFETVAGRILAMVDSVKGGLRGAPKFPNAPMFRFLWQFGQAFGNEEAAAATHHLLQAISAGGIYDVLAGGYARYATDEDWLVPHFEKMLYDNAQILELLAFANADQPDPIYRECATETIGWLRRDMITEGAFAASLDADSEGEEGKFYIWTADEVAALLGSESALAAAYDVRLGGNWEGKTILRRVTPRGSPAEEQRLADQRSILLSRREGRVRPGRDGKVLADWNGLAVVALVRAACCFDRPDWLELARSIHDSVRRLLARPDGRIDHAWCDGMVTASGLLDDQASMARAALALYEATGDSSLLMQATELVEAVLSWFADQSGGLFMTARDAFFPAGPRPRQAGDGPSPSGIGMLVEVAARLHHLTGAERWREIARQASSAWLGAAQALVGMPTLLASAYFLENGLAVAVTPGEGHESLEHIVLGSPNPGIVLLPHSRPVGNVHPAANVIRPASRSQAVVCGRGLCSPPVGDPTTLEALLGERARSP